MHWGQLTASFLNFLLHFPSPYTIFPCFYLYLTPFPHTELTSSVLPKVLVLCFLYYVTLFPRLAHSVLKKEAARHSEMFVPVSLPVSYPRTRLSESCFSRDRPFRELTDHLMDVDSFERSIRTNQTSDMVSVHITGLWYCLWRWRQNLRDRLDMLECIVRLMRTEQWIVLWIRLESTSGNRLNTQNVCRIFIGDLRFGNMPMGITTVKPDESR